jgi:hypothetical protein
MHNLGAMFGNTISVVDFREDKIYAKYTADGVLAGSAFSRNGGALLNTNLRLCTTAIVKVGEKSIKIILK